MDRVVFNVLLTMNLNAVIFPRSWGFFIAFNVYFFQLFLYEKMPFNWLYRAKKDNRIFKKITILFISGGFLINQDKDKAGNYFSFCFIN